MCGSGGVGVTRHAKVARCEVVDQDNSEKFNISVNTPSMHKGQDRSVEVL